MISKNKEQIKFFLERTELRAKELRSKKKKSRSEIFELDMCLGDIRRARLALRQLDALVRKNNGQ